MPATSNRFDSIVAAASVFPAGAGGPTVSGKAGKTPPGRLVSLSDLAELTGYDRDTIAGWIARRGLPIDTSGSASVAYSISVRRFVEWMEAQARDEERKWRHRPGRSRGGWG